MNKSGQKSLLILYNMSKNKTAIKLCQVLNNFITLMLPNLLVIYLANPVYGHTAFVTYKSNTLLKFH